MGQANRQRDANANGSTLVDLSKSSTREWIAGSAFALPYLLIAGTFLFGPLLLALYMSLYDWNALDPAQSQFLGLENYRILLSDPDFWNALWNTVYFVVLTVPPIVVGSLLLALGVNREVRGQWLLRTVFFSPYVLTVAVVGLLWTELFNASGLVSYYLGGGNWLTSHDLAMPAIAVATIWWQLAFNFIILLAARQNVSDRLYEAAKLDGASSWRMMRDITIPQMQNPLVFVVIVTFVNSFQVFGQPFIMTDGGPSFSTTTIVLYLYDTAFTGRQFGYAAAVGYVLFMILIAVSATSYYFLGGDD
ncbi:carbohydrate ABC transporter permease [Natrialba asiatica]|uniref:ABC transporter integral membrane protein n=1 Tax=Natrialba asiatica (strain ATCC 700177 / DSM 12278 / JCM 9576 / FERM P-10747 / NBRC 102637 / 172P1) TaxID=29540 RepID=M0B513_NATA1|nr:sugar ABC transporter permease [Natrialba asiatica]ELZ05905.1 ABC transporter integral membrane protein [Natrialba asiatica DSM 12278]